MLMSCGPLSLLVFLFLYPICNGQNCLPQGPCNEGYMDRSNETSYNWACGDDCEGGKYRTDVFCVCTCVPATPCYDNSIIFGFETPTSDKSLCCGDTSAIITMTLFWGSFSYQCDIKPTELATYYSCDTSDITTTSQCITNTSDSDRYALQIDNNHWDSVEIDRIIITDMVDNEYNIEYFCFNASVDASNIPEIYQIDSDCFDVISIDNDQTYPYNLITFNLSNISTSYIEPMDYPLTCNSCKNVINTPSYGGIYDAPKRSAINQGRINKITTWAYRSGTYFPNTVFNLFWDSDGETTSFSYGANVPDITLCAPTPKLDDDEYINGFRVISGSFIHGLAFYTNKGVSYECIAPDLNMTINKDSGIILYDGYYLTGFYAYVGTAFDAIAFQFKPLNNNDLCSYKYLLVESSESREDANNFCMNQYGTTLATVSSNGDLEIAKYIQHTINRRIWEFEQTLWIGMTPNDSMNCSVLSHDGLFDHVSCNQTLYFLCNNPEYIITFNPTKEPSNTPSNHPSSSPTSSNPTVTPSEYPTRAPFFTSNLIIFTHENISENWIAFNISNIDNSCGGIIDSVAIKDSGAYKNMWVNSSIYSNGYYQFNNFSHPVTVPISVRITKHDGNEYIETLESRNIIYTLQEGMQFDFGDNFCISNVQSPADNDDDSYIHNTNNTFYYIAAAISFLFIIIGIIALLDAKCCCRRNDHFQLTAIISSLIQILDMLSDIFFAVDVWSQFNNANHDLFQFLLIFILSLTFILIPIIISLFQLYYASSKYWLYDNRIREWLLIYSKFLYATSVLAGSSFTAIEIFNSNMFGLNIFYMGIPKQYLLSFSIKKVYSIILFENCPQLILSVWYTIILGHIHPIPLASMTFSLISIVVTIITIILQKRIYKEQDYVYITIDIIGESVMDHIKICQNRMANIKSFLCRSVLGVNEKSVEIMKPFTGSIQDGLQLQIHISYIHDKSNVNPAEYYEDKLNTSIENTTLQKVIQNEWKLSKSPQIGDIKCEFVKSKVKKQLSIARKANEQEMHLEETEVMKQRSIEMVKEIELNELDGEGFKSIKL